MSLGTGGAFFNVAVTRIVNPRRGLWRQARAGFRGRGYAVSVAMVVNSLRSVAPAAGGEGDRDGQGPGMSHGRRAQDGGGAVDVSGRDLLLLRRRL